MIKKITPHGNSSAIILDKALLELLNIKKDTPLEITTDGRNLIISPVAGTKREKTFKSALGKVNARHGATLKRLGE